jgi:hypothetical protein
MAYYYKCTSCGSNLDPGERCDCGSYSSAVKKQNYHVPRPRPKPKEKIIPLRGDEVFNIINPVIERLSNGK